MDIVDEPGESDATRQRVQFVNQNSCVCFRIHDDSGSEKRADSEMFLLTAPVERSKTDEGRDDVDPISLLPPVPHQAAPYPTCRAELFRYLHACFGFQCSRSQKVLQA